jgi:hypothetical protein
MRDRKTKYTRVSLLVRTDNEVLCYWYKGVLLSVFTLGLVISTYLASLSVQASGQGPCLIIRTVYE